LVEKAVSRPLLDRVGLAELVLQHIIRGTPKRRFQSKLYLFNAFGMLSIYLVVIILNFI